MLSYKLYSKCSKFKVTTNILKVLKKRMSNHRVANEEVIYYVEMEPALTRV